MQDSEERSYRAERLPDYSAVRLPSGTVGIFRKQATMIRIGIGHEWKTWRAWLASQQGGE